MFAFAIEKINTEKGECHFQQNHCLQNKKNHRSGVYCQKVHTQHLGDHMGAFNILRPIHLIRYTQQRKTDQEEERSSELLQVLIIDASLGVMVTAD